MSQYTTNMINCGVCGTAFERGFSPGGGIPDLDGRDLHTKSPSLQLIAVQCPHCGYASHTIEETPSIWTRLLLLSPYYKNCGGMHLAGRLCGTLLRCALIARHQRRHLEAGQWFLCAAWERDDKQDSVHATKYRLNAIREYRKSLRKNGKTTKRDLCILADLLRRTGQFQRLKTEFAHKTLENPYRLKIDFELYLAEKQDCGAYSYQDAVNWKKGGVN